MKMRFSCLAACLALWPCLSAPGQPSQAVSAWAFDDSIGVVTHFAYPNSVYYQQYQQTVAELHALHVHHIRDGLWSSVYGDDAAIHAALAQAHIGLDLVAPNPGLWAASDMTAMLMSIPEAELIEAPNEYDLAGGPDWASALTAYLPTVQAVGAAAGLPVVGPSLTQIPSYPALGNVAQYSTYANYHAYWGGRNPESGGWGGPDSEGNYYGSVGYDLDEDTVIGPGLPVMFTETGYLTNDTPSQGVPPDYVAALYLPRLLLHLFNVGVQRSYLYELADEPSSPTGFGLYDADLTPRPAGRALRHLMNVLYDFGANASTFQPGSVDYTLTGATPAVETVFLQKSNGAFVLAMWNNSPVWDVNAVQATPVAAVPVTITLNDAHWLDQVFTLGPDGTITTTWNSGTTGVIQVGSGVSLVVIR